MVSGVQDPSEPEKDETGEIVNPKKKRALVALCSGIALVIGIAAIIIPLAMNAGTSTSSAATVEIVGSGSASGDRGSAYADAPVIGELAFAILHTGPTGGSNFWRIPVTAPFSTMPDGQMCDAAQTAWLTEHAQPGRLVGEPVQTRVRNSADTGTSMSLGNIHVEGELVEASQVVTLQCGGVGGGGSQIIELSLDGSPGVWGEPTMWDQNPQPQGTLATLNLAPGEVADVTFIIADSTKRFMGRIVADLAGSESGAVVLVDGLDFPSLPMPGYYLSLADGYLTCSGPERPSTPCTFAEAEDLLREAGRR
jgi:hypothetical protein